MKKIVLSMHVSLDAYVAGPKGEMDWISLDEELFDFVGEFTSNADTALYGRKTYEMMNAYWPDAGKQPDASKHDIEHSAWYNQSLKVVISRTLTEKGLENTQVIGNNLTENIQNLKNGKGKNIMIFGSPSASYELFNHDLIDELWLFVNPVVLGNGIPLFKNVEERKKLTLAGSKTFSCGVIGLHYLKG